MVNFGGVNITGQYSPLVLAIKSLFTSVSGKVIVMKRMNGNVLQPRCFNLRIRKDKH